jgi:hypothetical protein
MTAKPWWNVAVPHRDIREGKFSESVFAANLGDVANGQAPEDYQDPEIFFRKTYLTSGLSNLLLDVANRLAGKGKGDSVIQVQTVFGGGKTHSLVALYHFFKNSAQIQHSNALRAVTKAKSFPTPMGPVRVAVFVGTNAAPKGKTIWGEIADQLGAYSMIKEYDVDKVSPGKDKLLQILHRGKPCLILIDELMEYATKAAGVKVGNSTLLSQTLAFLQELTEAVAISKNSVLVFSLPSSVLERFDQEAAEELLATLQKVSGRIERIYTPVEGEEVYEVIRKRLFDEFGDEEAQKEVADAYSKLYNELGEDIPPEAKELRYKQKIMKAYPFHPELIDLLFDRWGSLPSFQRTRGVLRLLAEVVADLYKKEDPSSLILTANVDLANAALRRELVKHVGNEYESVINADITGVDSNSARINSQMGSEYSKYKIATALSTAIFLYSFGKQGVGAQRVKLAFTRSTMEPSISLVVTEALGKMVDELWYLHTDDSRTSYYFVSQPNLNRIIVDKSESITELTIDEEMLKFATTLAGSSLEVLLWPKSSADIPDTKRIKLVMVDPGHLSGLKATRDFLSDLYENYASSYRTYKNNVLFLILNKDEFEGVRKSIRRLLALGAIREDRFIVQTLTEESRKTLDGKLRDARQDVEVRLTSAYKFLIKGGSSSPPIDLGLPVAGDKLNISRRVYERLKEEEILLDKIAPKTILDKVFSESDERKSVKEIWESFFRYSQLPLIENENVLKSSIFQGVKNGSFGLTRDDTVYFVESLPESAYLEDSYIIRPELAKKLKGSTVGLGAEVTSPKGFLPPVEGSNVIIARSDSTRTSKYKSVNLSFNAPWDKLSEVMTGVVRPLIQDGADVSIRIVLEAKSDLGINKDTINLRVKETLNQIGARVTEENTT